MSKYGVFKVVRTDRHFPKKATDPNADVDGMREYSFLECPHCHIEVEILTCALAYNKSVVTGDHIAVCTAYTGERPVKRCKAAKVVKAVKLVASNTTVSRDMFEGLEKIAKGQEQVLVAIRQENRMLKVHIKTLHASMEELEMECDEYEKDVAESWRDATARIRRLRLPPVSA